MVDFKFHNIESTMDKRIILTKKMLDFSQLKENQLLMIDLENLYPINVLSFKLTDLDKNWLKLSEHQKSLAYAFLKELNHNIERSLDHILDNGRIQEEFASITKIMKTLTTGEITDVDL